jgi:hypothetical protein
MKAPVTAPQVFPNLPMPPPKPVATRIAVSRSNPRSAEKTASTAWAQLQPF